LKPRFLAAALVLAALTLPAFAADALFEMGFTADKNEMTIGDELTLTIEVKHGKEMELLPLPEALEIPHFEVKRVEKIPPRADKGAVKEGTRVVLTTFELGPFTIAPFAVPFKNADGKQGQVFTEEVKVNVRSVGRTDKDKNDIRPLKSPVKLALFFGRSLWKWVLLVFGVLALGVVLLLLWKKFRRAKEDPEERLPPHERALLRLKRLGEKKYIEHQDAKPFFTELSEILEKYLIQGLKVGSEDLTTEEFLEAAYRARLEGEARELVRRVFEISDFVKFAKFVPPREDFTSALGAAIEAVERTKPRETEKKPEPAGAAKP